MKSVTKKFKTIKELQKFIATKQLFQANVSFGAKSVTYMEPVEDVVEEVQEVKAVKEVKKDEIPKK